MKIGIGVCSYNRPVMATDVCKGILNTIDKNKYELKTICSVDSDNISGYEWIKDNFGLIYGPNSGISTNKNRLIKYLSDCDIIVISEDDITFTKEGWLDLYIDAINTTKIQHFNYICSEYRKYITQILKFNEKVMLGNCGGWVNGVLMVMTKKCIDTVGGFDLRFKTYGFEHADFTRRCVLAGMYPKFHVHLMSTSEYIDWVASESCISKEDKSKFIEYNAKIYHSPVTSIYQSFKEAQYTKA